MALKWVSFLTHCLINDGNKNTRFNQLVNKFMCTVQITKEAETLMEKNSISIHLGNFLDVLHRTTCKSL